MRPPIICSCDMTPETLDGYLTDEKIKGLPNRIGTKRLSGRLWPTGEFSYGTYTERPDERLDERPPDAHWEDAPVPLNSPNLPNSHIGPCCLLSAGPDGQKEPPKKRGKYGKKGITGYGKKMLKSGGYLLQKSTRHYRLTFCTISLPSLPAEVRREVSEGWGQLLNRLVQYLSRKLERQGLPKAILCATEVQPKRLESSGEAYLHLHLIWPNHQDERRGWAIAPNDVRAWVTNYLETKHKTGAIEHLHVNTQRVKDDAAGYLAKYISKGKDDVEAAIKDIGEEGIPGQWWSMTKMLKDWVWLAMETGEVVGEKLAQWLNWAWDYDNFELFRYIYHVEVPINGALVTVGWRGCLSPEGMDMWEKAG